MNIPNIKITNPNKFELLKIKQHLESKIDEINRKLIQIQNEIKNDNQSHNFLNTSNLNVINNEIIVPEKQNEKFLEVQNQIKKHIVNNEGNYERSVFYISKKKIEKKI